MRLWHHLLIPKLDSNRLCDLHRTCCAIRGGGWGKRNKMYDYIYEEEHPVLSMYLYHNRVLREMNKRGFTFDTRWTNPRYRGRYADVWSPKDLNTDDLSNVVPHLKKHTIEFLRKDIEDLRARGVRI